MSDNKPEEIQAAAGDAAALRPAARLPLTAPERWLVGRFLKAVGAPPVRVRFWDGSAIDSGDRICAEVALQDRAALWQLISHPTLGFGEQYSDGGLTVEGDLTDFLKAVFACAPSDLESRFLGAWHKRRRNTLLASRDNIRRHYDIGNSFYELWLDREMAYTCAYFPNASVTLEEAQIAKMDLVCRKLLLKPNETVVEAGCGWGGLARHMARHYGVRVKAYNISREQIAYARERARREGLSNRIEYIEDDYRNIDGRFDAFVSVGMLEHVGTENYRTLGDVIARTLSPQGRGLIHTIGQNRPEPMGGWIEKHIFPGAYPPTLREMMDIFEPQGFSVTDVENLRPHYALTLAHWLERFERNAERIRQMFDERFVRAWRLYLASSQARFAVGQLQLYQVTFARPEAADTIPWTRDHLYAPH